jgi:hypothetical protein
MKVAIVAGNTFLKAVAFERVLLRYGASVIVFNSLDTAGTWLGIEVDAVECTLQQLRVQARGRTNQ